jgi:hypothetical protein
MIYAVNKGNSHDIKKIADFDEKDRPYFTNLAICKSNTDILGKIKMGSAWIDQMIRASTGFASPRDGSKIRYN